MSAPSEARINAILARATRNVSLESDRLEFKKAKGEAIKVRIEHTKAVHERVRANIIAQTTLKSSDDALRTDNREISAISPKNASRVAPLAPRSNDALFEVLRAPFSPPDSTSTLARGPKLPNDVYSAPLRTIQDAPMMPEMQRLVEVAKALERYNEHARSHLRDLEEERNRIFSGQPEEECQSAFEKLVNPPITASSTTVVDSAAAISTQPTSGSTPVGLSGTTGGGRGSVDKPRDPRLAKRGRG